MDLSGYYQMDGKDLWTAYSLVVESGSDDFLKYAPRKESITHDWQDSNGIDVDTSRPFVGPREISLRCAIITTTTADFWQKHNGLMADFMQPGKRRITVVEFGNQSFYCIYKDCNDYSRFTRVKEGTTTKIACKFTLNITEVEPFLDNNHIFIVDEDGRFLVA